MKSQHVARVHDMGRLPSGSAGQHDVVLAAFELTSPSDQWLWAESYGSASEDQLGGLAAGGGRVLATGSYNDSWCVGEALLPPSSEQDVFIAGFDL